MAAADSTEKTIAPQVAAARPALQPILSDPARGPRHARAGGTELQEKKGQLPQTAPEHSASGKAGVRQPNNRLGWPLDGQLRAPAASPAGYAGSKRPLAPPSHPHQTQTNPGAASRPLPHSAPPPPDTLKLQAQASSGIVMKGMSGGLANPASLKAAPPSSSKAELSVSNIVVNPQASNNVDVSAEAAAKRARHVGPPGMGE